MKRRRPRASSVRVGYGRKGAGVLVTIGPEVGVVPGPYLAEAACRREIHQPGTRTALPAHSAPSAGARRLHERDRSEPVVDVVYLAGIAEARGGEEGDDAVPPVAGGDGPAPDPPPGESPQMPQSMNGAVAMVVLPSRRTGSWTAEVHEGDDASCPERTERFPGERDAVVVVDVVKRQRRHHVVERGVLGRDPVGVPLDQGEGYSAASGLAGRSAQAVPVRVESRDLRVRLSLENGEQEVACAAADIGHGLTSRDAGQLNRSLVQHADPGHPGEDVVEREEPGLAHAGQEGSVPLVRRSLVEDTDVGLRGHVT